MQIVHDRTVIQLGTSCRPPRRELVTALPICMYTPTSLHPEFQPQGLNMSQPPHRTFWLQPQDPTPSSRPMTNYRIPILPTTDVPCTQMQDLPLFRSASFSIFKGCGCQCAASLARNKREDDTSAWPAVPNPLESSSHKPAGNTHFPFPTSPSAAIGPHDPRRPLGQTIFSTFQWNLP